MNYKVTFMFKEAGRHELSKVFQSDSPDDAIDQANQAIKKLIDDFRSANLKMLVKNREENREEELSYKILSVVPSQ